MVGILWCCMHVTVERMLLTLLIIITCESNFFILSNRCMFLFFFHSIEAVFRLHYTV